MFASQPQLPSWAIKECAIIDILLYRLFVYSSLTIRTNSGSVKYLIDGNCYSLPIEFYPQVTNHLQIQHYSYTNLLNPSHSQYQSSKKTDSIHSRLYFILTISSVTFQQQHNAYHRVHPSPTHTTLILTTPASSSSPPTPTPLQLCPQ